MLETVLYSYLTGDASVEAVIGDRLYPLRLAEGCDLPAIAYARVGASRRYTFDRFLDTSAWVEARMQFSCYAATAVDALEASHAVLLALSGYEGDMGGTYIGSARAALELDTYEATPRLYRRSLDIIIAYEDDVSIGS